MSKPNTQHIIGFAVKQYVANPIIVDLTDKSTYSDIKYVDKGYWL